MIYVAASSIITRSSDSKVLVGRRSMLKKYGPGEWETIGGSIEGNESPEECIKREILEELKTTIKTCSYFRDYFTDNSAIAVFIITLEKEPSFDKSDFEEIKWVTKSEIEKMTFVLDCKQRILDFFDFQDHELSNYAKNR